MLHLNQNKAFFVGFNTQLKNLRVVGATAPTTVRFYQCEPLVVTDTAVHLKFGFDYSQNFRNTPFILKLFLSFLTTGEGGKRLLSDVIVPNETGSEPFFKHVAGVAFSTAQFAMLWFESNSRIVMHDDSETSGFFLTRGTRGVRLPCSKVFTSI